MRINVTVKQPDSCNQSGKQKISYSNPNLYCFVYLQYLVYYIPGLSATKRMTAHPPTGTSIVFLAGGSTMLNREGSV